jgi:hypothetical protein
MHEIIEKWKLNKGLLASKMGMLTGTFCNKLNPTHTTQFSDTEIIRLKMVLKDMVTDLETVSEVEFNDALKAVVS